MSAFGPAYDLIHKCHRKDCNADRQILLVGPNERAMLTCKRHVGWGLDLLAQPSMKRNHQSINVTLLYELGSESEIGTAVGRYFR